MTGRWQKLGLGLSLWVALLLRVHNLSGLSLWNDEGNTVITARSDYQWTIAQALADAVHPPLFFFLEKLNIGWLGESEFSLRWLAAALGVLGVAALARLGREWLGGSAAVGLCALLLALTPFAVGYSREARMYSLLLLLNLGVMYWFGKMLRLTNGSVPLADKNLRSRITAAEVVAATSFCGLSALLYVTHYFGLFAPLIQLVFIIFTFRRHHRILLPWTALQALAALPIALWLYLQFSHGITLKISWIQPPTIWTLGNTWLLYTVGGSQIWQVAVGLLFGLTALLGLRVSPARWRWLLILWLALPALVTLAFSVRRPLYVDRYFIGSLAPLILLVALGLNRVWQFNRWGGTLATLTLAGSLAWQTTYAPQQHAEDWRGAIRYLAANERPTDQFVRRSIYYWTADYYYTGPLKIAALDDPRPFQTFTPTRGRVWLLFLANSAPVAASPTQLMTDLDQQAPDVAIQNWLQSLAPHLEDARQFGRVTLLLYDFSAP